MEAQTSVDYEGFKPTKTAHLNKVTKRTREENYSVESEELKKTNLLGNVQNLS